MKTLTTRSSCDYNCIFSVVLISTTDKTATVKVDGNIKRCKIKNSNGKKYIMPYGNYSMAPIFYI